jgi:transposase
MNPPKFVRSLRPGEGAEIERLIRRSDDPRLMRRAQIVRLSVQRKTCGEIADLLGFSVPTVHRVVDAFNAEGLAGLPDKPRGGRPPKVTERYVRCLKEAVARSPVDLGYPFASWTLGRLREHLARKCRIVLHPDYLARLMARHGIVYRRPRHVMGHLRDPQEYNEKKEILDFLKKARSSPNADSSSSSSMSVRFISTRP